MTTFVHHPDENYSATERIGARRVEFRDGAAEVTVPSVLAHYTRAGYATSTRRSRRPVSADAAEQIEAPSVVDE